MRRDDVLYVAGQGNKDAEIMFVANALTEEEAQETMNSGFGVTVRQAPKYLRGPCGMIRDISKRVGINIDKDCYYTALVKWLLPRDARSKPSAKMVQWGLPVLEDEIRRVKPKIIVAMGKQVFDMLCPRKMKFDEAHGAWFWSKEYNAHIYLMHPPVSLIMRPELAEVFRIDFREIKTRADQIAAGEMPGDDVQAHVISTMFDLEMWLDEMETRKHWLFSVDCEWHGRTHIVGQLRSIQFAYTDTEATYIRFRNEKNEYCFEGGDYAAVGKALARVMALPSTRYVGHHYSADAPWMHHVLGLPVIGRCIMDTEFAQQTVDESSELKLERGISMRYTTFGRYDLELILWKKDHKQWCEDGYGYIPDEIIIPYAIRDVLSVFRAVPHIRRHLDFQGLSDYYDKLLNPYVCDLFPEMVMLGLPMAKGELDDMRDLFHFVKAEKEKEFLANMEKNAVTLLVKNLTIHTELKGGAAVMLAFKVHTVVKQQGVDAGMQLIKQAVGLQDWEKLRPTVEHLEAAPTFNIRSAPHMRRWLFDVEGKTPIKSTNKKAMGLPSMAWDKVLELPKDRQAQYTPAVDKQTIMILSEEVAMLDELLDLNMVGNICKAFLKQPDVYWDEDLEEEVTEECGLHQWLAEHKTGEFAGLFFIHGQYSLTETSRPRSWQPNSLNWPKFVGKRIEKTVRRILQLAKDQGRLPAELGKWVDAELGLDIPSIRSLVTAPAGWCLTESDYKTAEMYGLATISGDRTLLRILSEPDPEWAVLKDDVVPGVKLKSVRVMWAKPSENGIPYAEQKPELVMAIWKDNKFYRQATEDDLVKNPDGSIKHAAFDIHWSLAEWTYERPREFMEDDIHRAAGKVGNRNCRLHRDDFSINRRRRVKGSPPVFIARITFSIGLHQDMNLYNS